MEIEEIRREYKYAKNKKKCISILAELNNCSIDRIIEIVHAVRETEPGQAAKEWVPLPEQKALMDRLDELDALIKPLEDEYRQTAADLMKIAGK